MPLAYASAEAELDSFKGWFSDKTAIGERDIVRELKKYDHLSLLMSFLGSHGKPDLLKYEFEISGVFRADLVVGSKQTGHLTLIEFEGGEKHSLFGPRGSRQMRDWGSQLQHGIGQVIDWSRALNDAQHTEHLRNAVGLPAFGKTYVVVCGRDGMMDQTERSRLRWMGDQLLIANSKVLIMTYDDLMSDFEGRLDVYRAAREETRSGRHQHTP
jgi:Domain of unknown function (DUF4263)